MKVNTTDTHPTAVVFLRARHLGQGGRDQEREQHLIAHQRAMCEQAGDALGAQIIREYVEFGGSGSIDKRPVLRLMLDELRALHDTTYLIVTSPDRLVRRTHDAAVISLELEAAGTELITAASVMTLTDRQEAMV